MQPSKCPHCGAPAQIPPATQFFTRSYCKQQFDTGWRQPVAFPDKPAQQPQVILVRGPDSEEHPASATIVNGVITGTDLLAEAGGNAHVNLSGNVTASGPVKQTANGKISGAPASSASAKKK